MGGDAGGLLDDIKEEAKENGGSDTELSDNNGEADDKFDPLSKNK